MHGIHEWVATSATSNSLPTSPCLPRIAGRGSRLILPRLCSSLRTSTISLHLLPSRFSKGKKKLGRVESMRRRLRFRVSRIFSLFLRGEARESLLGSAVITRGLIRPRRNCTLLPPSICASYPRIKEAYLFARRLPSFSPKLSSPSRIPSKKFGSKNIAEEDPNSNSPPFEPPLLFEKLIVSA